MPTPTYTPLANITLGVSTTTVTFSSISQSYRDLVLVISELSSVNAAPRMRFNNDTGVNYAYTSLEGGGSTVQVESGTKAFIVGGDYFSITLPENIIFNMLEYTAAKRKHVLGRVNGTQQAVAMTTHCWNNTAAITTISLFRNGANFAAGTTFSLFGVIS